MSSFYADVGARLVEIAAAERGNDGSGYTDQRVRRRALVRTLRELAIMAMAAAMGSNWPCSPKSQVSPPGTPPAASKMGTASPAARGMSRML